MIVTVHFVHIWQDLRSKPREALSAHIHNWSTLPGGRNGGAKLSSSAHGMGATGMCYIVALPDL